MKKGSFITIMMLFAFLSNGQIELKSKDKKVEKLTCEMDDVNLRVYLPKEIHDYDLIDVQVRRYTNEDYKKFTFDSKYYGETNINFSNVYYKEEYNDWDYIDYHIVNGDKSDLRHGFNHPYSLTKACNYPLRDFEELHNRVVILGGVHTGWRWHRDKKVKTYDYKEIKDYIFIHEIGPVSENNYNPSGEIGLKRIEIEGLEVDFSPEDNSLKYKMHSSEEGGGTADFGAAPSENVTNSLFCEMASTKDQDLASVKASIERDIINASNYYWESNKYYDQRYFNLLENKFIVYEDAIVKSGGSAGGGGAFSKIVSAYKPKSGDKNKEKVVEMLDQSGDYFSWETISINGESYEVLDLPIYDKKQTQLNAAKNPEIKSEEKGKTKLFKVFIKEKNDVVYVAGILQIGDSKRTAASEQFINHFESGLTIK